jgi:hypothetical protein
LDGKITKRLAVGPYTVSEVEQPGYQSTTSAIQNDELMKDTILNFNFGNRPIPPTLKILKFEDINRNGVQDLGEPGLSGWNFSNPRTHPLHSSN